MAVPYNYQNIRNRLKRDFWAIIAVVPYFFIKNKNKKNKIISKLIGEYPNDMIKWLQNDKLANRQRFISYSLPEVQTYSFYFYKKFQEYKLGDNTYIVEFPNTFNGIKQYFKYIYNLNPQIIQVHDSLLVGVNNFLIKWTMKPKMIFMPRGMNYYGDFIFRDRSTSIQWLKAHWNRIIYTACLRSSSFVNAPAILALENELVRKKEVYTSDYLLCQGAISSFISNDYCILKLELENLKIDIDKYTNKIFTFSRVEKLKLDNVIDNYINIKDKIDNSCLIIIGDGSALEYYKNKYTDFDNIIFTGWVDKNDAFDFIKDFDLMIAPSGGYSLIEVGLLGIPTVAYNYDIMSSLIYNRVNGYLIDKKSPEELKSVLIEHFSKSDKEVMDMKSDIKKIYEKRFNLDILVYEKEKIVNKIFHQCSSIKPNQETNLSATPP